MSGRLCLVVSGEMEFSSTEGYEVLSAPFKNE